jgi:hypothetical protein
MRCCSESYYPLRAVVVAQRATTLAFAVPLAFALLLRELLPLLFRFRQKGFYSYQNQNNRVFILIRTTGFLFLSKSEQQGFYSYQNKNNRASEASSYFYFNPVSI